MNVLIIIGILLVIAVIIERKELKTLILIILVIAILFVWKQQSEVQNKINKIQTYLNNK